MPVDRAERRAKSQVASEPKTEVKGWKQGLILNLGLRL